MKWATDSITEMRSSLELRNEKPFAHFIGFEGIGLVQGSPMVTPGFMLSPLSMAKNLKSNLDLRQIHANTTNNGLEFHH
jgi:hypothetical protein